MFKTVFPIFLLLSAFVFSSPKVKLGIDRLFDPEFISLIEGKRIGLITNHTAISHENILTAEVIRQKAQDGKCKLGALFAPEHGLTGAAYESEKLPDSLDSYGTPVFSLHGSTLRPTKQSLSKIDVLVYDIQDIGSRSYTYTTTLFYAMEEAAKADIPVVVLDRPNPINGLVVDGPLLEDKWRSFVGYINVPYCHGMTIGELAKFFNSEYDIGCNLTVVPMQNWKRKMTFQDTGLTWVPTSPHIPEATTPFYYPVTGLLGELQIVNIGVGYTLPFKVIGAPWIDAEQFAKQLNKQNFPGVHFLPFHFKPFYGRFAKEVCHGVQIVITNNQNYKPVSTQYLIIGILKSLYPKQFKESLAAAKSRKEMFSKVNGTEEVLRLISEKNHVVWPLRALHEEQRQAFLTTRQKYLLY